MSFRKLGRYLHLLCMHLLVALIGLSEGLLLRGVSLGIDLSLYIGSIMHYSLLRRYSTLCRTHLKFIRHHSMSTCHLLKRATSDRISSNQRPLNSEHC